MTISINPDLSGMSPDRRKHIYKRMVDKQSLPSSTHITSVKDLINAPFKSEHDRPLEETYLERLIETNILKGSNKAYEKMRAREVRALYKALSARHQKMFTYLVKSLEPDKDKIGGVIWAGGAMRVISASAATILLKNVFDILGVQGGDLYGTSAGTFQEYAFASGSLNSNNLKVTTRTKFEQFHGRPDKAMVWVDGNLRNSLKLSAGIDELKQEITYSDIAKLGYNPQVIVGVNRSLSPFPITPYTFPEEAPEEFGIGVDDVPLNFWSLASHHLPGLYYSLPALLGKCGNCTIYDNNTNRNVHLYDAGLTERNHLYIDPLLNEVTNYTRDTENLPRFFFVVDNQRGEESVFPKRMFGSNSSLLKRASYNYLFRSVDFYNMNFKLKCKDLLERVGAGRTVLTTFSKATNPITGRKIEQHTLDFESSVNRRETIIGGNLQTAEFEHTDNDFPSVLEQLYDNLVDPVYRFSDGARGKTAYEMYLEDIHRANDIPPIEEEVTDGVIKHTFEALRRSAAAL